MADGCEGETAEKGKIGRHSSHLAQAQVLHSGIDSFGSQKEQVAMLLNELLESTESDRQIQHEAKELLSMLDTSYASADMNDIQQ